VSAKGGLTARFANITRIEYVVFTVYVIRSTTTNQLYKGHTDDLQRRLSEHSNELAHYTRGRGPWELVHSEEFPTRSLAMAREKFLKTGQGRQWLKEKLHGRACLPKAD